MKHWDAELDAAATNTVVFGPTSSAVPMNPDAGRELAWKALYAEL